MSVLTIFAVMAFVVIGGLHLLWAMRVWWPIANEGHLARSVAGFPGITRMPPPAACLGVAGAAFCVALILLSALRAPPPPLLGLVLWGAGVVLMLRGAVGFTGIWARLTPEQPFRRLDRRIYSPLCLVLGAITLATATA